jgi:hypothetical protein
MHQAKGVGKQTLFAARHSSYRPYVIARAYPKLVIKKGKKTRYYQLLLIHLPSI